MKYLKELDSVILSNQDRERRHLVELGAKLMTLMEEEKITKAMWKQKADDERHAKEAAII